MPPKNQQKKSFDIYNTQEIDISGASSKNTNSNNSTKKNKSSNKNKKTSKPKKSLLKRLVNLVLAIFVIYSAIALFFISKVDRITLDNRIANSQSVMSSVFVKNILLIGTDGRSDDDVGRSDSMMLLSIDSKNSKLTVTSIMRDIYLDIPDYHYDKLNAAYSYGGATLLIDTIEENFSIKIDDCIIIDFDAFMDIVDSVGGIDVTISDSEMNEINNVLMSEGNKIAGDSKMDGLLTTSGDIRLNGKQALTYSRIRYVGNADFERTQRQRYVVNAIIDRLKTPNIFRIGSFLNATSSNVSTNMDVLEMYLLSLQAPFMLGYDVTQQRIPAEDTWYYDTANGQSVIMTDFQANIDYLYETIYAE